MKNLCLIALCLMMCFSGFSQEKEEQIDLKKHNNEIATDVAPFIRQFMFNNSYSSQPSPYALLYRRHFNKWALRLGVGGYGRNEERVNNDTLVSSFEQSQFDFKIGIERKEDFAKKWQFFYGIDFYTSSVIRNSENSNINQFDEKSILENQTDYVGVSPFFGFRFKLNQRLSITTSANMQFYGFEITDKRMYLPDSSFDSINKTKGSGSIFNTPQSVFITFNF